jgi:hypothetical protein
MPISFACRCGKRFTVPDDAAGKQGRCSACKTIMIVPDRDLLAPPVVGPELVEPPVAARSHPEVESPPRRRKPLLVPLFCAAALVGTCLLFVPLSPRRTEPDVASPPASASSGVASVPPDASEPPVEEESHAYDRSHPDFGGMIRLMLLKNAAKKMTPGSGMDSWLLATTSLEKDVVLLNNLDCGVSSKDVQSFVRMGYGHHLDYVIRVLNRDIDTDSSRRVARALGRIRPYVRWDSEELDHPFRMPWVEGDADARQAAFDRINEELQPISKAFGKDIDHYLYRLWRLANPES